MSMPKHLLALPLQKADTALCAWRLVNSALSKTEWPWARCQLDSRDLCMGSISQNFEVAHTPLCMSNSTHTLNNFRPQMLSHGQLLNPLCLNMLPLDAHTPKAPTSLIFCNFHPYQTAFHAFSGLPFWLETKLFVSKGSTRHVTHALSWDSAMQQRKVLLRPTILCQGQLQ